MLKEYLGERYVFTGTRGKVSLARGTADKKVVCVTDIKLNGKVIKDHSWFHWDNRMAKIPKDKEFKFVATIVQYISLDEKYSQVLKYRFDKIRSVEELA